MSSQVYLDILSQFGDLLPDGRVDDKIISNNGDMIKVLSTIVRIIISFTDEFSDARILFLGSTTERNKLYTRIIRTHYPVFSQNFSITGLLRAGTRMIEHPFNFTVMPKSKKNTIPHKRNRKLTPEVVVVIRTVHPVEETHFPEKLKMAKDIVSRTKFLDSWDVLPQLSAIRTPDLLIARVSYIYLLKFN